MNSKKRKRSCPCYNCKYLDHKKKGLCYCKLDRIYKDPTFIEIWGCNDFKYLKRDKFEQLSLFNEV